MPNLNGVNIAFAAGTGTLTFMDFVAALARLNLGTDSTIKLGENFKFIFFASFQERAESLGLELCEALHAYCQQRGIKNFELVLRLSKEKLNAERWNDDFVQKTIKQLEPKKVWVCGPPVMSEVFERYLFAMSDSDKQHFEMEIL